MTATYRYHRRMTPSLTGNWNTSTSENILHTINTISQEAAAAITNVQFVKQQFLPQARRDRSVQHKQDHWPGVSQTSIQLDAMFTSNSPLFLLKGRWIYPSQRGFHTLRTGLPAALHKVQHPQHPPRESTSGESSSPALKEGDFQSLSIDFFFF